MGSCYIIFLLFILNLSNTYADYFSLIEMLKSSSPDKQKKNISEIVKIGQPAVSPLIKALKNYNYLVRSNSIKALSELGDTCAIVPLINTLQDPNVDVRISAIEALKKFKDARAVEPLIELLNHEDEHVRINALIALKELKDPRASVPFLSLLNDSNERVRIYSIMGLGELNNRVAVKTLITFLKDSSQAIRISTIWTLGMIKDTQAVEPLIDALKDNNSEIQYEIIKALGKIRDERAIEPLIKAFNGFYLNNDIEKKSKNDFNDMLLLIRKASAEALCEFNNDNAIQALIDALEKEDNEIQMVILKALLKVKYNGAVKPLINTLKNENKEIRQTSAKTLGEIGDPVSFKPLVDALKDKETDVQLAAIEALGMLKDKKAYIYIINFLIDKNTDIQNTTIEALRKISDKNFGKDFEAWMNWWEDEQIKNLIIEKEMKSISENNEIRFFLKNQQYYSKEERKARFINYILKWKNDQKKIIESQFINILEDRENGYALALDFIKLQNEYKKVIIDMSYHRFREELLIEEPFRDYTITLNNNENIIINGKIHEDIIEGTEVNRYITFNWKFIKLI